VFAAVEIVDDSLLVAFSQHSQDEPSIVSAFVYVGDDKAETLLVIVVD